MSVATFQPAALSAGLVVKSKMDRKRAVSGDDDLTAPPGKRLNGGGSTGDVADVPKFGSVNTSWQVDLETYQKDAILRQLKEYKREKQDLEKSLQDLEKKSTYHSSHLRVIDVWWKQLIDEVATIVASSSQETDVSFDTSSLLFADSDKFQEHLSTRSDDIKKLINAIYSNTTARSDTQALQKRINGLLAREKDSVVECQRLAEEVNQLREKLDNAAFRYVVAEKKLDRMKSQAVANVEKQGALASTVAKLENEESTNGDILNGDGSGVVSEEAERDRAEAVAVAAKLKEQLAQLEAQNLRLTKELTTAKARLDSLTDEDYAATELFKVMKSQLENSLNKINDLEATHIQLREEAKKMHAERTAYRIKIDEESLTTTSSTEMQLANRDADLQRIRAARDDVLSKQQIAEGVLSDHKSSVEQSLAIAKAREDRINALENEVERLRLRCGEFRAEVTNDEMAVTDVSDLRAMIAGLRRECKTLEEELPSIEQAYKKAQAAASAKLVSAKDIEDQIALLKQGKVRADQKYFGIMKHKEQLESEILVLRRSEKTSSGIISSLKDADAKTKELAVNLERQNAEHTDTIERTTQERLALEQKAFQASMAATGYQNQLVKLKEALGEKDSSLSASESSGRESQREVEALKVRLEDQTKKTEEWRKKANSSSSDEVVRLRRVAFCHCNRSLKDTVISACGHIVCKQCVDDRVVTRQRKCPICMKAFGNKDYFTIHLV